MTTGFGFDGNWLDFLEDKPEAGYFSYQNQWRTPNQKKYYQNQFQEIQNEYLGRLGQQLRSGGAPTEKFTDFLGQFPWTLRFMQLPPSMRGDNPSLFNPRTTWNIR